MYESEDKSKEARSREVFHAVCVNELGSSCYFFAGWQQLAVCRLFPWT